MKKIELETAKELFKEGIEIWVEDMGYTYNDETEEYEVLMHPKSIYLEDEVEVLEGYDSFFVDAEHRVFLMDITTIESLEVSFEELTDEEFIEKSDKDYSLKEFEDVFNDYIDSEQTAIRIIEIYS